MNHTNSSASDDEFRVLDLFGPADTNSAPHEDADDAHSAPPRVSDETDSFLFANPLFAPTREAKRPH